MPKFDSVEGACSYANTAPLTQKIRYLSHKMLFTRLHQTYGTIGTRYRAELTVTAILLVDYGGPLVFDYLAGDQELR